MRDKTNLLLYYITYTPLLLISSVFLNLIMFIFVVLPNSLAPYLHAKSKPVVSPQYESDAMDNHYWIENPIEDHSPDNSISIPTPVYTHCSTEYGCNTATPDPF